MKFFDLELGGLGAAGISWTNIKEDGSCTTVRYTNGTSFESCGRDTKPGTVTYGKNSSDPCGKKSIIKNMSIR